MIRDSAETVKRVSIELGGNAPMIVFEDADLEKALDLAVPTKYANSGQVCVARDRFYIHESMHDSFVEGFSRRARALRLGHGLKEDTQMGPLINQRRLTAIEGIVEDAKSRGGKIVTGGKRPAELNTDFFFEPAVITELAGDARALAEENFGSIAAITPLKDRDEVYGRANASEMGLSAYVFTRDANKAREAVSVLSAGKIGVNSFALAAAEAPFGGVKASGMGREGGVEGILDYSNVKLAQVVI